VILDDNEVALAEARFDRPPEPLRRFGIIAASARTGSHLLCRLLRQLGRGVALEYFYPSYRQVFEERWRTSSPGDYLSAIMRNRTAGGLCVVKCLPLQYGALRGAIEQVAALPDPFIIHLWRRDSLAQAISLRLAVQSGFWNFTPGPTTQPKDAIDIMDLDALRATRRQLVVDELLWRGWLRESGWPVIHVCYEDLIADRGASLQRLLGWLEPGAAPGPLPTLPEPPTPAALHARQSLNTVQRAELAAAYRAQFGHSDPLPDP
jgi:LPS sulfotransferase NodH